MSEEPAHYDTGQPRGGGIPLGQWSGSDAVEQLERTVEKHAAASEKQGRTLISLTRAIIWLTIVLTVVTVVQVWTLLGGAG